ncbi:hypothetical protein E8E11_003630 [Didymella keratinophila]|nr:hypothetical protein E8E11_003630 [Didymella keratinophila]
MADAPITPKTIYVVYVWSRDDQSTTANRRVTRCFPSIIGSPPVQRTDDEGKKHGSWTAVKDGMAFDFTSNDMWCHATDARPQDLRERILGVMISVDPMVAARNEPGKVVHFDWREPKKGMLYGMLQRHEEADELPIESFETVLEIPVPVLTLLR